jgi:outer membrane lipoprotein-sorting protein
VKSRQLLTALALGLLLAPAVHAQTVDEILTKHFAAQGGVEKMKALNSMRITGSITVGQGMEAPVVMERKRPGKQRLEFTFQGMVGVQAFDGEQAWSVMPFMGKKDPEAASEEDTKLQKDDADFDGPLLDWKAKGHTVELAGKEQVEGAEAFKLKVTKKNGYVDYYYIDTETYLLVKQDSKRKRQGTEFEAESFFSDYKDVEGYMLPFTMEQAAKGAPQRQKFTFAKVEVNVPIDDARFKMPAVAAATDTTKAEAKPAAAVDTTKSGDAKSATAKKTDPKAAKGKKKDQ